MAAADLGIDRVEFRRRNLIAEADMPYALAKVQVLDIVSECDSGDYQMTLDRCLAEFNWAERSKLQGKLIDGRYHGIAVGCYLEGGGTGPRENVRLVIEADGKVSVFVGSSSVGQGVETVFSQIAADALELPMERINNVFHGSTDYVTEGFGSFSSRSIVMGGNAIVDAANKLRALMREAAAQAARLRGERDCIRSVGWWSGQTAPRSNSKSLPGFQPTARTPATSEPTPTARTPPMSRSIRRPARSH